MEQTVHATLAGVQFSFEASAYRQLREYLDSLESHFAHDDDRAEIMRDIETRIAEKLSARGNGVASGAAIGEIIAEIGSVEDLGGEQGGATHGEGPRRLYRDPDDCIIGGVASGIAAYFGIDPIITRLLFLLSIFVGGTGIIIYAVLWLIVPTAESTSQKLEMRGHAVTLDTVRTMVKERISEAERHGSLRRIMRFPFEILRAIGRLLPGVARISGILIMLGSFVAVLGLTVAATLAATNYDAAYLDFPLRDAISPMLFFSALAAGYLVATVPFVLFLLFGRRISSRGRAFPASAGFTLVGIWSLALIIFVALVVRATGQYATFMDTDPRFVRIEQIVPLATLTGIETDGVPVTITSGSEYGMHIAGTERQIAMISATTSGSVLVIERRETGGDTCIFCDDRPAEVTITVPSIQVIGADDTHIDLDHLTAGTVMFRTQNARIEGDVAVRSAVIEATNSSYSITGRMTSLRAALEDSELDAHRASIGDAEISATQWSSAYVNASGILRSAADDTSTITYLGSPHTVTGPATTTQSR